MHRHVLETVVILEEGNILFPRFPQCDMLIPLSTLNISHPDTSQCARGAEKKRRWLDEDELRERKDSYFEAYGASLENVTAFKYLGRVIMAGDNYWSAVVDNFQMARKSWGRLSRILSREG